MSSLSFAGTGIDYTDANCQGAWLMDADENPIQDASANNVDLSEGGSGRNFKTESPNPPAAYSTGYYEYAVGADVHISANDGDIDITDDVSMVCWVQQQTQGTFAHIMGKRDGVAYQYQFRINEANYPSLLTTAGSVDADSTIGTGSWVHLGVSSDRDGNTAFFVDGVADGTPASKGITTQTIRFTIGRAEIDAGRFDGYIDEPAIFDDLLNSTEINDIMDNGLAPVGVAAVMIQPIINIF